MRRLWILFTLVAGLLLAQAGFRFLQPIPETPVANNRQQSEIEKLGNWLISNPNSAEVNARLGLIYLQQVRESGDVSYYTLAENHLNTAIENDPNDLNSLIGQGILAAARHDFHAALDWAKQARAVAPHNTAAIGILVDAYVELGRYEEAVEAVDLMNNIRPDLSAYSRMSYVRELHGDIEGSIEAMEAAVNAGVPASEEMLWSLVQLGDLHLRYGDPRDAHIAYAQALQLESAYPYALDGLARLAIKNDAFQEAIEIYEPLVERLPLPQFAWQLGDAYAAMGNVSDAENAYGLVRAMHKLNEGVGMDVELELVLFDAEHGADIDKTVALAYDVYEARPTVYAADALAWSLYQAGHYSEAMHYSNKALSLGTRDPLLFEHADAIAENVSVFTNNEQQGETYDSRN